MRESLTADGVRSFMSGLADAVRTPRRVYVMGGASAVLLAWRTATIDLDLKLIPETDELLRSLPQLKKQLHINIELASPDDFIPALPEWQERSQFIQQEGNGNKKRFEARRGDSSAYIWIAPFFPPPPRGSYLKANGDPGLVKTLPLLSSDRCYAARSLFLKTSDFPD
jgi:hypothetical protein